MILTMNVNAGEQLVVSLLTILIGVMVAGNFALAKFLVQNGVSPAITFYWQLVGASALLLVVTMASKQRLPRSKEYLRYYMIGGIIGVSAPQFLSYVVLQQVPASLFTMLVTLSPLLTFVFSSIASTRLLPTRQLVGILIGLAGVIIATVQAFDDMSAIVTSLLLAFCIPVLLSVTNLYRERAFPTGANPLALESGYSVKGQCPQILFCRSQKR